MHIPDGYLSVQTNLTVFAAMAPLWAASLSKVKKVLSIKQIPALALCSAFSFVIMMFNVPLGASSVHAVGAVLIAILLGPWSACIAVSTALIIQALVFGDGGILAIGANCFNMAFAMPFSGYYTYRLIAGNTEISSKRSMAGIFTGSYVGMNVAALLTAVMFGIQPLLFKAADGTPLFGFYPLSVSVPVIMFEHIFVAGPIEGIVTTAAIAYLSRYCPQMFENSPTNAHTSFRQWLQPYRNFIIGIAILIVLAPLGLIATGTAWGEWGIDEVEKIAGFIPEGLERFSGIWQALIPDYSLPGLNNSFFQSSLGYIISAAVGVILILALTMVSSKLILQKKDV